MSSPTRLCRAPPGHAEQGREAPAGSPPRRAARGDPRDPTAADRGRAVAAGDPGRLRDRPRHGWSPGDGARPVHGAVRAPGRPAAATNRCADGDRLVPRHDRDRDGPAPALARVLGDGRAHIRVRSRLRRGGRFVARGGEGAFRRAAGTRHGRVRARAQRRCDARGWAGGTARTRHRQLALVARIARSRRRAGGAGLGTALARLTRTCPSGRDRRPPAVAQRLRLVGDSRVRLPGALLLRPQRVARRRADRGRLVRGQRRRASSRCST